jgi:uncharacterized protein YraI
MTASRLLICAAITILSSAAAVADPAYVASTVNLRADASTSSEVLGKIPGGSLVDATGCSDWCQVEWQGKRGYAIASALDRSGRVPARRAGAPRVANGAGAYVEDDDYVPVGPPVVYAPAPYYGYGPYYGPRWGYGYRRGWRRW